jgi:hypothetical protein
MLGNSTTGRDLGKIFHLDLDIKGDFFIWYTPFTSQPENPLD